MTNNFDEISYWEERLKKAKSSLKGVGHKGFSEYANSLMYKRTREVLNKILDDLAINLKNKSVLDAGAGIGAFIDEYQKRGAKVTAVDISDTATKILKKNYPKVITKISPLETLTFSPKKTFYIVHCFDVLYHITDSKMWVKSVKNLAKLSKKYVFIHSYAERWDNYLEPHHVEVDRKTTLKKVLKGEGFKLIATYPTHILFLKTPVHLVSRYFPDLFYSLDSILLNTLKVKGLETVHIEVFERVGVKN